MSAAREREIAKRLAADSEARPPAGLLERIKGEIPPEIAVGTEARSRGGEEPGAGARKGWRPWLLAASLVMTIGASVLGLRVMRVERLERVEPPAAGPQGTATDFSVAAPAPSNPRGRRPTPPPPPRPVPAAPRLLNQELSRSVAAPQKTARSVVAAPEGAPAGVAGGVASDGLLLDAAKPAESAAAPPPAPAGFAAPREKRLEKQAALEGSNGMELKAETSSFELTRRALEAGHLPPPAAIRVDDFLAAVDRGASGEPGAGVSARQLAASWGDASPSARVLTVAADLARVLQAGPADRASQLPELLRRARSLRAVAEGRPEVATLVTMVEQTATISAREEGGR